MPLAVPLPNLMSQAMASHTLQAEEDAHGAQDAQAEERAQAKDGEGERALTQVGGGGLSVQALEAVYRIVHLGGFVLHLLMLG